MPGGVRKFHGVNTKSVLFPVARFLIWEEPYA